MEFRSLCIFCADMLSSLARNRGLEPSSTLHQRDSYTSEPVYAVEALVPAKVAALSPAMAPETPRVTLLVVVRFPRPV